MGESKNDGEMITMSVSDLAKHLDYDVEVVNAIADEFKFPDVKVKRRLDGSLVYGVTTRAYLEGARVVHAAIATPRPPTREELRQRIPDLERELVEQWRWTFGTSPVRAYELVPFAGDLISEFSSDRGKANAMGQRLSRMCGRDFDGYTVVEASRIKNTAIYQLQRVASKESDKS